MRRAAKASTRCVCHCRAPAAASSSACRNSGTSRPPVPASTGPATASSRSATATASCSNAGCGKAEHHADPPGPPAASLYPAHLATLRARADQALAPGGFDHLLIAASTPLGKFLDDQDYPFVANPHFKHWLPLTDAPGSWIAYTPGSKPKLVFVQPRDYWHVVPEAPHGYWVEHFDIVTVRSAAEAAAQLPQGRSAALAPACPAIDGVTVNNPQAVLDYLHWHRSYKTPYELALMREANRIGARAHRAA